MHIRVMIALGALGIAPLSAAPYQPAVSYSGPGCSGSSHAPSSCLANTVISFSAGDPVTDPERDWWFSGGTETGSANQRVFSVPGTYVASTMIDVAGGVKVRFSASVEIVSGFALDTATTVLEADGIATFTIYKSALPDTTNVTIDYATADGTAIAGINYVATSGTLTFAPGQLQKTVTVPLIADDQFRHASFQFSVSDPSIGEIIGARSASVLIIDDEPAPVVAFTEVEYHGNEGSTMDVTLVRTGSSEIGFSVWIDGGVYYYHGSIERTMVEFAAGELTKTVHVALPENACFKGPVVDYLYLDSATNGAIASKANPRAVIIDDEPQPALTIDDTTSGESDGTNVAMFTLRLSGRVCYALQVALQTVGGSAKPWADFWPKDETTFLRRETTREIISVSVMRDLLMEPDETFYLQVRPLWHHEYGAPVTATCTIIDDDGPVTVVSIEPPVTSVVMPGFDVHFRTRFAVNVSGVDASDFDTIEDGVDDSPVVAVSGSGIMYDVVVHVGTKTAATSGSIALRLVDNDSIIDELGNPLGGPGAGNGNATSPPVAVEWPEAIPSLDAASLALLAALLAAVALAMMRA